MDAETLQWWMAQDGAIRYEAFTATPLAMTPADRYECEATMRVWYGETWYRRPDPADLYQGEA